MARQLNQVCFSPVMSTQEQARSLMMRHHNRVLNRQQSLLSRVAAEVGLDLSAQALGDRK